MNLPSSEVRSPLLCIVSTVPIVRLSCGLILTSALLGCAHVSPAYKLYDAIVDRNTDRVRGLIHRGVDVNSNYLDGSPLALACLVGDVEICRALIGAGADVRYENPVTGRRIIHYAAKGGDAAIVELLFATDVDATVTDGQGKNALHYAVSSGEYAVLGSLAMVGLDVNDPDCFGRRPIHDAVTALPHLRESVAAYNEAFVETADEQLDVQDYEERIYETVKHLANLGADLNCSDYAGNTPLSIARSHGEEELVAILTKLGEYKVG